MGALPIRASEPASMMHPQRLGARAAAESASGRLECGLKRRTTFSMRVFYTVQSFTASRSEVSGSRLG